jgi:hypothetical protein
MMVHATRHVAKDLRRLLMIGLTESLPEDGGRLESWSRRFGVYRRPESGPAS